MRFYKFDTYEVLNKTSSNGIYQNNLITNNYKYIWKDNIIYINELYVVNKSNFIEFINVSKKNKSYKKK